jgi:hypothetical protein
MIQTSFFPQPKKEEPIKIIQIDPSGFQPKKVEDLLPHIGVLPDTYMIYPTGGYHPFYGVPNTFPRYQLPIWPYVKRIKYSEKWGSEEKLNNVRAINFTKSHVVSQLNYRIDRGYPRITLHRKEKQLVNIYSYTKKNGQIKKNLQPKKSPQCIHRLVALAWIPNPKEKRNVCHINDDPTNYLPENLIWGTQGDNMKGKIRRRPDTMEQKYLDFINKGVMKG